MERTIPEMNYVACGFVPRGSLGGEAADARDREDAEARRGGTAVFPSLATSEPEVASDEGGQPEAPPPVASAEDVSELEAARIEPTILLPAEGAPTDKTIILAATIAANAERAEPPRPRRRSSRSRAAAAPDEVEAILGEIRAELAKLRQASGPKGISRRVFGDDWCKVRIQFISGLVSAGTCSVFFWLARLVF